MADQALVCEQCGLPATAGDRFCGDCGNPLPPPRQFCTSCGAENPGGARFCSSCGTPMTGRPDPDLAHAPPPTDRPPAGRSSGPPPAGPPDSTAPQPAAAISGIAVTQPGALIGAVIAVIGAVLAWFDFAGVTTSAFDVPALYLLDYQTTSGDAISVGLLVVLLAAGVVLACLVPRFVSRQSTVRLLGSGLAGVVVLFGVQLVRTANEFGQSFTDLIGIGAFVTAAGAVAVLSGR